MRTMSWLRSAAAPLAVFTWDKSFRHNPVIGSPLLNRLGLHVARVVATKALFDFRLALLRALASPADRDAFARDGVIVKHDFLPPDELAALRAELRGYEGRMIEVLEGESTVQRVLLTSAARAKLPVAARVSERPELTRLLRYASSKNRSAVFFVENLCVGGVGAGYPDPQRDMHSDTFHPCVKAWLYLDDVTHRNAPFVYVPGSHRLSWRRLAWEHRQARRACERHEEDRYWDGSFRVSAEELNAMGYPEPRVYEVPANTLVIANTRGFHRRGDASEPSTRLTLWMQLRDNPFNPFPTPLPKLTTRLFDWIWERTRANDEPAMIAAGAWRPVVGRLARDEDVAAQSA